MKAQNLRQKVVDIILGLLGWLLSKRQVWAFSHACSFSLTQMIGLTHPVDEALNNCHVSLFHWGFTLECVF